MAQPKILNEKGNGDFCRRRDGFARTDAAIGPLGKRSLKRAEPAPRSHWRLEWWYRRGSYNPGGHKQTAANGLEPKNQGIPLFFRAFRTFMERKVVPGAASN
ncbi:MAG: hypothetical protein P4M15_07550 [Alphaproteobacteria bacterium]|nr:hypothetical protein [Alphaproteobacteria bacterium]